MTVLYHVHWEQIGFLLYDVDRGSSRLSENCVGYLGQADASGLDVNLLIKGK